MIKRRRYVSSSRGTDSGKRDENPEPKLTTRGGGGEEERERERERKEKGEESILLNLEPAGMDRRKICIAFLA